MNILIVGLGSIARKHIKSVNSLKINAKFYALRSKPNSLKENKVNNIYSLSELLIKPDFAIISNPTSYHEKTIMKLINLKVPLFIEKPVLNNYQNASKISSLIKKNQILTYVACNMRFHPSIIFLKSFIDNFKPIINEINVYSGSYLPSWRENKNFRNSYSSSIKMGGGVHLDLIHEIDYCRWIFGDPKEVNSIKRSVSSLKINSIDFAKYTLLYDKFSLNLSLNYYRKDSKREIELVANNDTIIIDLLNNKVLSKINNKVLFEGKYSIQDTYNKQMKYFISKINNKEHPVNSFDEGVKTLILALNE